MKKIIFLPISLVVILIGLNVALAIGLGLTYHNLTNEKPILTLKFDKTDKSDEYIAHLFIIDNQDSNHSEIQKFDYRIYGNQWRVDAIFVKMKYFANIFGVESKYALDRIEGRYKDIKDENSKKHFAYKIESHKLVDWMSPFVDTTYGSSVYRDITPGVEYTVLKTPTGLMVRVKGALKDDKSLIDKSKDYINKSIDSAKDKLKSWFE
jgi:hypothetical protein